MKVGYSSSSKWMQEEGEEEERRKKNSRVSFDGIGVRLYCWLANERIEKRNDI
jgi:hypothetical protein